ncbi:MAG TPA: MerR family transcriptional regulator [Terriglobales bacterium]|nr:MerR family transcriptional regulator [Terriglobales bacterium]
MTAATLSRTQLARRSGVHLETIRYYERIGLLPPVVRSARGIRAYPANAIVRLELIREARQLGFGLAEIRDFLGPAPAAARMLLLSIDDRLKKLRELRARVLDYMNQPL